MLTLLLFQSTNSLLDRAIDVAEGSPTAPTHAAIQLDATWLVEAVVPLVRAMPVAALPANVQRVPLTLTDAQAAAVTSYLMARQSAYRRQRPGTRRWFSIVPTRNYGPILAVLGLG